jgi:hypothetical protein
MFVQNSAGPFGSPDRLGDCFRDLTQEQEMPLILVRFPSVPDFPLREDRSDFGHKSETLPKSLRLKTRLRSILFL